MKIFFACVVASFACIFCLAEDASELAAHFEVEHFKIARVEYEINGRTTSNALELFLQVDEKREFDADSVEVYKSELKTRLEDTKIFKTVEVSHRFEAEGAVLHVAVEDSNNSFFLIGPSYSSSRGFKLEFKFLENNLFGSMNPFTGKASFLYDTTNDWHGFDFLLNTTLNFRKDKWIFDVEPYALGEFFSVANSNYIASLRLDALRQIKNYGVNFAVEQQAEKDPDYREVGNEFWLVEKVFFAIPFEFSAYPYKINFDIGLRSQSFISLNSDGTSRPPFDFALKKFYSPDLAVRHNFKIDSVHWDGHFRRGFFVEIEQDLISYNFHPDFGEWTSTDRLNYATDICGEFFHPFNDRIAVASRVVFAANIRQELTDRVGQYVRGVVNYERGRGQRTLEFANGIIFNVDFPIHIFKSDWENFFIKLPQFVRNFELELQFSPFFDIAFGSNPAEGNEIHYSLRNGIYTFGGEFLLNLMSWRFLTIRFSCGINLSEMIDGSDFNKAFPDASICEIYFGSGLHF